MLWVCCFSGSVFQRREKEGVVVKAVGVLWVCCFSGSATRCRPSGGTGCGSTKLSPPTGKATSLSSSTPTGGV